MRSRDATSTSKHSCPCRNTMKGNPMIQELHDLIFYLQRTEWPHWQTVLPAVESSHKAKQRRRHRTGKLPYSAEKPSASSQPYTNCQNRCHLQAGHIPQPAGPDPPAATESTRESWQSAGSLLPETFCPSQSRLLPHPHGLSRFEPGPVVSVSRLTN